MIDLDIHTSSEICFNIARKERVLRKSKRLTQIELSEKSGVSLGSLKRFETTGQISLSSLTNLAIALDADDDFLALFSRQHYDSIEDVIRENN